MSGWHNCTVCQALGYRKDKSGGLDRHFIFIEPMHPSAQEWHHRIYNEMFLKDFSWDVWAAVRAKERERERDLAKRPAPDRPTP